MKSAEPGSLVNVRSRDPKRLQAFTIRTINVSNMVLSDPIRIKTTDVGLVVSVLTRKNTYSLDLEKIGLESHAPFRQLTVTALYVVWPETVGWNWSTYLTLVDESESVPP